MKHIIVIMILLAGLPVWGQGRGRGAGGMNSGGGQGMGRSGGQAGQGTTVQTQQRDRTRATSQQRDQYRSCIQATQQLHKRVRNMARLQTSKSISAEEALRYREQLRTEAQLMREEQARWNDGLSPDQAATVQQETEQMTRDRKRLEAYLDALDFELQQETVDTAKVREQAGNADEALKQVKQQQQRAAEKVGLQP